MEDILFVKVDEPKKFRKDILESVKTVIHSLQRFERIKEIRLKKIEKEIELKNQTKQLANLISRLEKALPETKIKEPREKTEKKAVEKRGKKIKVERAKPKALPKAVEDLHAQLDEIEEKLKVIS